MSRLTKASNGAGTCFEYVGSPDTLEKVSGVSGGEGSGYFVCDRKVGGFDSRIPLPPVSPDNMIGRSMK